jgi:2-polyprenyl-6-methoxyphenol hydroxylase-like FAD-dependent oxidoreductase
MNGRFETYIRGPRAFAAWSTNDDLTLGVGGWPYREFEENKKDVEGNFMKMLDLVPEFAKRIRAGKREERWYGAAVPNFFRKPFGPGWALAGDAGYNKDFITAMGISDAFSDADRGASAIHSWLEGSRQLDDSMGEYQKTRDAHVMPTFELTCQIAALEPPSAEFQQLLGAVAGKEGPMNQFAQMMAGVKSPAEFFAPENVEKFFQG